MPVEINNKTKKTLPLKKIKLVVEKFLEKYKQKRKTVSLAFISDRKMKEINDTYRGFFKTTDVLSFLGEDDFLGEILISPQQIEKQAKSLKKSFSKELFFILVHGLLHLVGRTDETEENRLKMIEEGEKFLIQSF